MVKKFSYYSFIICALFCTNIIAQDNNKAAAELLNNAQNLIQQRDYEKAQLTIKLYQKYVEKNHQKWLNAQLLLIRCNIELNNYIEADTLTKRAEKLIEEKKLENSTTDVELQLLKAEQLEIKNSFHKAAEIYKKLLQKPNSSDSIVKLANNLIDRIISGHSKNTQDDYEELRKIVSDYEQNQSRNPLELIRLKQKINAYRMINEETLKELEKLSDYWIQKDEYTLFKIYLNSMLRNYKQAYEIWLANKDIFTLKTHPLTIPALTSLSRHFLDTDLLKSKSINQSLSALIRDNRDRSNVTSVIVDQLIAEKKPGEALVFYEEFSRVYKNAPDLNSMLVSLSEAFLDIEDFKTSESLLKKIDVKSLKDPELKSRKIFIEASLLQTAGKDEEAAVLFLRVGQTVGSPQTALKSLFMAGKSFYKAKQCNRAIIAFKSLLEKPRNKFSDEAMYFLSLSHAQCKEYKQALEIVDKMVITGKSPEFKKMALYDKGSYLLKAGSTEKAIEAYNDYTVVYTNDSRNASIWYKIYGIYKSANNLEKAGEMLAKIISGSSQSSPEVYSDALHQLAILSKLKGDTRESIKLWQTYLEFNQKTPTEIHDEVKLMLAAAYQNSDSLDLTAARSIYSEILTNSTKDTTREIAAYNLINLVDESTKNSGEYLGLMLNSQKTFTEKTSNLILKKASTSSEFEKNEFKEKIIQYIDKLKKEDQKLYWQAYLEFKKNPQDTSKADAILEKIDSDEYYLMKLLLERDFYYSGKNPEKALSPSLEIIYRFSSSLGENSYFDWDELTKSAIISVTILKKTNMMEQAVKIRDRINQSKIPNSAGIVAEIDKIIKSAK